VIFVSIFASNAFGILRSPYPGKPYPPDHIIVIGEEEQDRVRTTLRNIEINRLVADQVAPLTAVIEQAGVPALRVAFTIAVVALAGVGLFIFHKRHQFFDRDLNVENDVPAVRHNRIEEVVFVWSGPVLVLLSILFQVWSA
jgi:hypothetical protein